MSRAIEAEGGEVVGDEGVEGCGVGGVGRKRPHVVVIVAVVVVVAKGAVHEERKKGSSVAAEARWTDLKARCMHAPFEVWLALWEG